jgi:hypothetical protein
MSSFRSQRLGSCAIGIAAALWLSGDANGQAAKRQTAIAQPTQSAVPELTRRAGRRTSGLGHEETTSSVTWFPYD